jgi:hypothetical protein
VKTYPLRERSNKVHLEDIVRPEDINKLPIEIAAETAEQIEHIAQAIVSLRGENKPVVFFTGAHLIKNGLGCLLADLVRRDMVTLVAGNGATAIHDFELALIGQTSEDVPRALEKGDFGMAREFGYINATVSLGNKYKLGYGESLGRVICDADFRNELCASFNKSGGQATINFLHQDISVLATCYEKKIPCTIHVGIGTDVIDQHESFDGCAKGGCSGRDFLIFTDEITRLTKGGIILNVGSAVTGPEVLLKAVSMAANVGKIPRAITTADFDLRPFEPGEMKNESSANYYCRDQKSVVTRIPQAFEGKGFYICGNQKQTIPLLYKKIIETL